jgi:hypothetical protein
MNTCRTCFGTVIETTAGTLVLVGEPFLPMAPHIHRLTGIPLAPITTMAA